MPYDADVAALVRPFLEGQSGVEEKRMFGGVVFMLQDHMCVGVWKHWVILRLGAAAAGEALALPTIEECDITGRPMAGWVMLDPDRLDDPAELAAWVELAADFVRTLPPKPAKKKASKSRRTND
ncbi:TfoX/Sxy family protein [Lignipirellula cremea]|uniref:TfoX N-terminal domain-containing protein n=1 Tax=Lignipirellula cremea TaxID=2528010 RepID=A0A518DPM1_9BACT|nr:TfoX/Sxy family protein [Lignipirellula cremea]QDU93763.1 hypothetical protein Pla8534_15460 [Lignipirellula cremea]